MQNKSKYLAFAISMLFLFQGCDRNPYDIDTSNIALESEFIRFDTAFFNVDTTQLAAEIERLEQKYPPFFEGNTSLIYWRNQLEDPMQRKLHQAVMESTITTTSERKIPSTSTVTFRGWILNTRCCRPKTTALRVWICTWVKMRSFTEACRSTSLTSASRNS